VLDLAGRIPSVGNVVEADGHRIEVLSMDRNRVDRVAVIVG
jgi:CBS domain containing-hemolysin-like protein